MSNFDYFFSSIAVIAAIYIALGRNLLRVFVAFFIELFSVGIILLSLHSEYLSGLVLVTSFLVLLVLIAFSSMMLGSLKNGLNERTLKNNRKITQVLGILLGLAGGFAIGKILISTPFIKERMIQVSTELDASSLGQALLGKYFGILELLSILVLVSIVGAALLLRRDNYAD